MAVALASAESVESTAEVVVWAEAESARRTVARVLIRDSMVNECVVVERGRGCLVERARAWPSSWLGRHLQCSTRSTILGLGPNARRLHSAGSKRSKSRSLQSQPQPLTFNTSNLSLLTQPIPPPSAMAFEPGRSISWAKTAAYTSELCNLISDLPQARATALLGKASGLNTREKAQREADLAEVAVGLFADGGDLDKRARQRRSVQGRLKK